MAILKSKKKVNTKDRVTGAVTSAVVGAGMSVLDGVVGEGDMLNYGSLAVGIALPMFVPGTEKIGDAVAAIAAYKLSKELDLAGKLGLTDAPKTTGLGDRFALGDVDRMFIDKSNSQKKNTNLSKSPNTAQPLG